MWVLTETEEEQAAANPAIRNFVEIDIGNVVPDTRRNTVTCQTSCQIYSCMVTQKSDGLGGCHDVEPASIETGEVSSELLTPPRVLSLVISILYST